VTYKLRREVSVSPDPGRDDYEPGRLVQLAAGTPLDEIHASELAQLAPAHFYDADGSDVLPDDWRTNEATLEHDRRQEKNQAAEAKEREKRKAAKNKAGG
jgi:hypothetical protein